MKAEKIYCPTNDNLKGRKACPDSHELKTLLNFITAAIMKHDANGRLADTQPVDSDPAPPRPAFDIY